MRDATTERTSDRASEYHRPIPSSGDQRAPNIPAPIVPARMPRTQFPPGATDCHAHLFGPQARYPLLPQTHFVPHECLLEDYIRTLTSIGCQRAVLIQPSVYGSRNDLIEDALARAPEGVSLRGVAVVDPDIGEYELERLHGLGFRGIRINLAAGTSGLQLSDARLLADRIRSFGWHLQFYADFQQQPELADELERLDATLVIDHFGRAPAAEGTDAPGFQKLLRLLRRDNIYAKLSAPYFISKQHPDYQDITPLAAAMLDVAPDRLVWGTDWPHASARAQMPDDDDLADLLARWIPDAGARARVLASTPARLYGFDDP
jgi:2-pyrone-4,6-dicarboxylate lactonase